MRRLLLAAFIAIVAQGAHAADPADLPILRGSFRDAPPAPTYRAIWQGFYVGGQAGYGVSNMAFGSYNADLSARLTANPIISQTVQVPTWPVLQSVTHRSGMFGGFAGYNAQFENVVVGIDGSYMHGTFTGSSFGRNTLVYTDSPFIVTSNSDSQATMKITDFGSLRIRGGYTMGSFLPYLSAGVALARADVDRNVAVRYSLTQNGTTTGPFTLPPVVDSTKQFLYGFTLGAGLDWMLFNGLFLRTEYEYLQFTSSINTNIHTVRAGVGYKF